MKSWCAHLSSTSTWLGMDNMIMWLLCDHGWSYSEGCYYQASRLDILAGVTNRNGRIAIIWSTYIRTSTMQQWWHVMWTEFACQLFWRLPLLPSTNNAMYFLWLGGITLPTSALDFIVRFVRIQLGIVRNQLHLQSLCCNYWLRRERGTPKIKSI